MGRLIHYSLLIISVFLAGCQVGNQKNIDEKQQESILTHVGDFNGLIKLYREQLSHKEDKKVRYLLAKYYYLSMDYESSRYYLSPLLAEHDDEVLLLEGKNLLEQGHTIKAMQMVNKALIHNPKNGDALNIQGVLLVQQGNYHAAKTSFDKAREYIVDENKVINNLAMLSIMQEDYITAKGYLMSLYLRGYSSESALHNLVFVLVKMKDFNGAEALLRKEKKYDENHDLIESLVKIKPRSRQLLQQSEQPVNSDSFNKEQEDL